VLSVVVVLVTQSMYSAAIDKVSEELKAGSTPTAVSRSSDKPESSAGAAAGDSSAAASQEADDAGGEDQGASQDVDYQNLSVGETVSFKDGLSITVNSIEGGLQNYDGSEIVCVNVTYANAGSGNASFNVYDWKAEDADGAQRMTTYYSEAENELNSGNLSSGGRVTGNLYFDAPVAKVHYYDNMFNDSSSAAWVA
jgi:hypothetical protein